MQLSPIAKVFGGPEGERVTLVRVDREPEGGKTPFLLRIEGTDTPWDGRVFEVQETMSGTDRADYAMTLEGAETIPVSKRGWGSIQLNLPGDRHLTMKYLEQDSRTVDRAALMRPFQG